MIAFDKEFSLCANYPKGHGELFLIWLRERYPDAMLFHAERAGGGRQDLALMALLPIFWNCLWCVELLDERLRVPNNNNILQKNLFTVLTCAEMVAVARLLAIVQVSIGMQVSPPLCRNVSVSCLITILPMFVFMQVCFLTGKTHEWNKHEWGVVELGRAFDAWYDAFVELKDHPEKFLERDFMMSIFSSIKHDLRPFEEYLDHMFENKLTASIGGKDVLLSKLLDELFDPQQEVN